MAISPGIYNFNIRRRSDHTELFQFCDGDGIGIDLSGWEIKGQGWLEGRTKKLFDFIIDDSNADEGYVRATVPSSISESLPKQFEYDILLINPSSVREYYVAGTVTTTEGLTT